MDRQSQAEAQAMRIIDGANAEASRIIDHAKQKAQEDSSREIAAANNQARETVLAASKKAEAQADSLKQSTLLKQESVDRLLLDMFS